MKNKNYLNNSRKLKNPIRNKSNNLSSNILELYKLSKSNITYSNSRKNSHKIIPVITIILIPYQLGIKWNSKRLNRNCKSKKLVIKSLSKLN